MKDVFGISDCIFGSRSKVDFAPFAIIWGDYYARRHSVGNDGEIAALEIDAHALGPGTQMTKKGNTHVNTSSCSTNRYRI